MLYGWVPQWHAQLRFIDTKSTSLTWSVAINICIHFTVQLIHDIPSSDDGTCQPEVTFVNVCRYASQTGLTERTSSARSESGENFDRAT